MANEQPITVNRLLKACYTAFFAAGVFSFAVNLLMLTMPVFMFQVYDRVLASRSESTLYLLLLIAAVALAVQACLDGVRAYAFVRISGWIDRRVGPILLSSIIIEALERGKLPNSNPLRSLDTLRMFLTGPGMLTMLDVPWVPIFLLIIFWINLPMGIAAVIGAVVMFCLGVMNDRMTRKALNEARDYSQKAYQAAESAVRNAAVVESMGMRRNILARWRRENEQVLALQGEASDRAAIFQAISKSMRMMIQMVIMTVSVIQIISPHGDMTPGMMIAVTMILGRALQPVEMGISQARNMIDAVSAYKVVEATLQAAQSRMQRMTLPPPTGLVSVENVGFQPRSVPKPILQRIGFELDAGEVLGIIGPSAAGKSSLARLLVGVEKPTVGHVRLDGADAFTWNPDELGRHVGFMPQDVELFAGSVAENIARLDEDAEPEAIIKAARMAGLHDMILRLPDGYDTQIGNAGAILSGGQRQRVALARALYGDPQIVVLDEPNASLDASGDDALLNSIKELKQRGATVIIITHRPATLVAVDKVLVLQNGMVQKFGPRDEVLAFMQGGQRAGAPASGMAQLAGQPAALQPPTGAPAPGQAAPGQAPQGQVPQGQPPQGQPARSEPAPPQPAPPQFPMSSQQVAAQRLAMQLIRPAGLPGMRPGNGADGEAPPPAGPPALRVVEPPRGMPRQRMGTFAFSGDAGDGEAPGRRGPMRFPGSSRTPPRAVEVVENAPAPRSRAEPEDIPETSTEPRAEPPARPRPVTPVPVPSGGAAPSAAPAAPSLTIDDIHAISARPRR